MDPPPLPTTEFEQNYRTAADIQQVGSPRSLSLTAQYSVARDIQEDPTPARPGDAHAVSIDRNDSSTPTTAQPSNQPSIPRHSITGRRRRSSSIAAVPGLSPILQVPVGVGDLIKPQQDALPEEEERRLLKDNHIIPPKRPHNPPSQLGDLATNTGYPSVAPESSREDVHSQGDDTRIPPSMEPEIRQTETSPLLPRKHRPSDDEESEDFIARKWDEAVTAGEIQTSWRREAKVLARYSPPLFVAFALQYSLTMANVFAVGHLGTVELGAVSLGSMTAVITGYATYQGLATSLDTLCAQAYGSGRKELVGLQLQRMVLFLWCITIPIGAIWLNGRAILEAIVPEKEVAQLAGLYLKIVLLGAPGIAAFESGKRYVQAQGLFSANLYVLLFCAPLNAFMNWLFVWKFKWGFVGAPIAVVVTDNLLPLCLFLYVYFIDGRQCWGGIDKRAFKNWGPMIRLTIPGFFMVIAEYLAFEILTLASSWISATHLAAQAILATVSCTTYQIPFPVSIAASTRIAHLIGAALPGPAKTTAKVATVVACFLGVLNITLLVTLRNYIPRLFTSDKDVIRLVSNVLPVVAAFQLFDALVANCNGILRAIGRQKVGGAVGLFCYYAIGMPVSFGMGFGLHLKLHGLWAGPAVALALVGAIEGFYIYQTSWERAVEEAKKRNSMG